MSRPLRLHPAAQRELDEAAAYYDAESPGLGSVFLSEFEHALQQIRSFSEAAPVGLGSVRARVLVAFPYSLHYALLGDDILVLALAHHSRRPFYWRERQ
jgi:toxin ParE1/3/4